MRRLLLITAIAGAVGALTPTPVAAAGSNSYVTSVTYGQHATYDRLVLTFHGTVPNYNIHYVNKVHADPSGHVVHLKGHAKLLIVVHPTKNMTPQPQGTWTPLFPELRQIKGAGNWEGYTSYGVGLAAHKPYHVSQLTSPDRLVIDIDHP